MRSTLLLLWCLFWLLPLSATAQGPELRFGYDLLARKQSAISGLHQLSLTYRTPDGYYLGQSLYSAASGSGGGFFVGGVEFGRSGTFGPLVEWDLGQFIGGGGGASQIEGDGLMLRTHALLQVPAGQLKLGLGVAWISLSGSEIETLAYSLSLSRPFDLRISAGRPQAAQPKSSGAEIKSFKPIYSLYLPRNSRKRSGSSLGRMHLLGAEFVFGSTDRSETFIQANGAAAGDAEGYADWFMGKRYFFSKTALQPMIELGLGTAGGGDVNTDGGLIFMAGAGTGYTFDSGIAVEVNLGVRRSFKGSFLALAPSLKASIPFGRAIAATRNRRSIRWQLSTGLSLQHPDRNYWKSGEKSGATPILFESGISFFILDHVYLAGQAYTAIDGEAGGYQLGLLGIGYQHDFGDKFSLSFESLLGAGGGAGVNTRGGLLMAYRLSADFWLSSSMALTCGFGQIATVKGDGMSPKTYHLGLKFPFSSWYRSAAQNQSGPALAKSPGPSRP
jgi:hypothetical protein